MTSESDNNLANLPPEPTVTPWRILVPLLLAAFVLRYGYILQIDTPPFSDMADYETMAFNLLDGQGLVMNTPHMVYKAYRPPLYPLFIAAIYKVLTPRPETVRVIQALLSTATLFLVYLMTRELLAVKSPSSEDPARRRITTRIALLAVALLAFEETSIFFCGQLLSETLFIFLLVWLVYLVLRGARRPGLGIATLIGMVGGCLILTRPVAGPLILFCTYWFFLLSRKVHPPPPRTWKEFSLFDSPYSPPLIILIYAGVIVMCWGLRNQAVLDEFVPVSTNGGVNFYLGHHEGFGYHSFGRKEDIRRSLRAQGIYDEVIESKVFTHAGLQFIRQHPRQDFINTLKKLDYLYFEPTDWTSLFQPWKWWNYLESPYRPWPWESNGRAVRFWPVRDENGDPLLPTYQKPFWQEGRLPLVFWGWPTILLTGFGVLVGSRRFPKLSLLLGVIAVYTLTLLIFFTNARFRAPLIPFFYVFAAVGIGKLVWGLPETDPDEVSESSKATDAQPEEENKQETI